MESVVAPVIGQLRGERAVCNVLRGGVRLEYYGLDYEPLFPDPEQVMRFKVRKLQEDGHHVVDWNVMYDPDASPKAVGWVVYTEGA